MSVSLELYCEILAWRERKVSSLSPWRCTRIILLGLLLAIDDDDESDRIEPCRMDVGIWNRHGGGEGSPSRANVQQAIRRDTDKLGSHFNDSLVLPLNRTRER